MKKGWLVISLVVLFFGMVACFALAEELKLVPFEDQENGFSISYPGEWEVQETEGFVFFAMGENGLNLGIIKREGDGIENTTLSEFAQKEKGDLEEELKDFNEIEEKDVMVNGQKAILRIYEYKIKVRKFKSLEYYIQGKKDGFVVVFDGPYPLFDELKNIAEKSIATFKLIGDEAITTQKPAEEPKIVGRKIEPLEEWKNFTNKEKGFSLSYPASWKVVTPYEDVIFEVDGPQGYQFQLLNHNLGKAGTVKAYFQSTGRWLKKHLKDYEEIEAKEIEGGYERAYRFTQNNKTNKVMEYYFVKRGNDGNVWGFTLVFIAPEDKFEEAKKYFQKIENSFTLNPEETKVVPTPTPEKTIALPTPTPKETIALPTPKPTSTPMVLPTPKKEESTVNINDFIHYKNPDGLFEVMIPKGLSLLDEGDESIVYGDLSKGYIVGAGTDIFDTEEVKPDIDFIMKKLTESLEDLDEDLTLVEGPKKYKDGAMILGETEEAPYPGMKDTTYYAFLFVKPREKDVVALAVILPKSDYEKYKPVIDFMIDSLK